ncbi:hypothetical protein [Celeribacter indicus]|uniref:Uncharacterized protein n=1 Tax=Celeribacter indicus TaxID=1208324 RepID=A0A0B5DVX1_9RHOB|nr:hypothetical protein [Celeribacter indicus]AJE45320.1 hypothetical protein P73_0605 [Celeribacter indicus]SDX20003.1 hypothetical protein SAMN05443573_11720 [Celeribacter indicus]
MKRLLPILFALLAAPLAAQSVIDCGSQSHARNLVEPWEETTRTFANGEVRVTLLDTVEPAGSPFYLLLLSPPRDELGGRQCRVIADRPDGAGFWSLGFAELEAEYDPARGLVFTLPAGRIPEGAADPAPGRLTVVLNQSTGEIDTAYEAVE